MDEKRGSGTTTFQMREASEGAYYVWCNDSLRYPKQLAKDIGRSDLQIVGPSWLEDRRWQGLKSRVILDHACDLTERQREAWFHVRAREAILDLS